MKLFTNKEYGGVYRFDSDGRLYSILKCIHNDNYMTLNKFYYHYYTDKYRRLTKKEFRKYRKEMN